MFPIGELVPPCSTANPITSKLPKIENSQKIEFGFSPPLITANTAVLIGNMPKYTNECAEVMCCKAKADSKGNPITPPIATIAKGVSCVLVGLFSLNKSKQKSAKTPAIAALAAVTNMGSNEITATFVAGIEPLNNITPINPFIQPLVDVDRVTELNTVACFIFFILLISQKYNVKTDKHSINFIYLYGHS